MCEVKMLTAMLAAGALTLASTVAMAASWTSAAAPGSVRWRPPLHGSGGAQEQAHLHSLRAVGPLCINLNQALPRVSTFARRAG
jgi:hypothetical protein